MAQLLLAESCTVTIAHSRTRALSDVVRRADIVVAAVGRPEMVKGSWLKEGAVVIDVGINRVAGAEPGKTRLVGDVDFADAMGHVRSEEHTSELQSLMRISYAVFCLKKKTKTQKKT